VKRLSSPGPASLWRGSYRLQKRGSGVLDSIRGNGNFRKILTPLCRMTSWTNSISLVSDEDLAGYPSLALVVQAPEKVSKRTRRQLQDGRNELLLSAASVWEIAIKYSLGKLPLPSPPESTFLKD